MRDLPIELLGSAFLRERAAEVTVFDDKLRELADAMFRTMYRASGQGLAAPQVGILQRLVVIDMPNEDSPALVLVNPRIVEWSRETGRFEEGCLSIPGVTARVTRPTRVVLEYADLDGSDIRLDAEGELADCIQHEVDHLDGILYIDHLSALERQLVLARYRKLRRRA